MRKTNYIVGAQSILLAVIGLELIVESAFKFINGHIGNHQLILANAFHISSGLALTLVGILLVYLVPYLYRQLRIAYIASLSLVVVTLFVVVLQQHKPFVMLLSLVSFTLWMTLSHRLYKVKSDSVSLILGVGIALLVACIGYVYGCIGFLILGPHGFHQHFTIYDVATLSFQVLFTFRNIDIPTQQAELFVNSLDVVGGLVFILVTTSLFKPVRFALTSSSNDRHLAKEVLTKTSTSSEDYFKLWPTDKHYYFSTTRQSFIAYKMNGHTAIILGDPCGDKAEFTQLFNDFCNFVTLNGWLVAVVNAKETFEKIYKNRGLNKLFIGNEAIINIADFIARTAHSKHFRYVDNRAQREGLTTEYWQTLTDEQIAILRHISNAWLSQGGRKEYTFFMGYFDASYLRASSVMVLKQNGRIIAYINVIPSFIKEAASIDHLRSVSNAPSVSMHYLLAQLIYKLDELGKTSLNIGLAPLSGIEQQKNQQLIIGRLLKLIKKLGGRFYSFEGVEQFKNKSSPVWHPRYIYYTGGITSLTTTIRDIERVSRPMSELTKKYKIIGISIVVILSLIAIQFL